MDGFIALGGTGVKRSGNAERHLPPLHSLPPRLETAPRAQSPTGSRRVQFRGPAIDRLRGAKSDTTQSDITLVSEGLRQRFQRPIIADTAVPPILRRDKWDSELESESNLEYSGESESEYDGESRRTDRNREALGPRIRTYREETHLRRPAQRPNECTCRYQQKFSTRPWLSNYIGGMMVICEQWSGRPKCARCSHSPGDHSITFLIAPARWLIKSVFIVHAKRTYNGWYFKLETGKVYDLPLPRVFDAILAEDFPFVKSHIQLHQASVYDCDSELNTLLDYATISRDPTITSYLVDRGAHADSLHELGCPRSPPKSLERGTFSKLKTFLKQRLWRALRPKLRDGFYQVTWTCPVCNKSLYDTLETKDAESTESFSRLLKGIQETVTLVQHPKPTFDPSGSRSRPIIYRNNSGSAGQGTALPRGIKTSQIGEPPVPRFLELCLNAGNSCQTVGEVTLTGVQSDSTMFSLIKLKLRSMRASRALQLKFGRRLFSKLVKVKFVKFGLEPTGGESAQSPKAHIFEEPSYPTAEDVSSQRWHCDPVPKTPNEKPMPSSVFIHYLLYCDGPPTDVLLKRLPKKLRLSLLKEAAVDDQLLMAWGMQLIEGPDKAKIVAFMISVLVICIGPLVVYIFLSHGIATASGVASVFVAVVTLLWMAMRVYQDQED